MSTEGWSLSFLERELEQLRKDRDAWVQALSVIRARILESNELPIPRRPILHEWSGTHAVVGSLEITLNNIERTIEEVKELVRRIKEGELPNTDPPDHPGLGVIDGGRTR
jgi:hypothetical protein